MGNLTKPSHRSAWPDFAQYGPYPTAKQLQEWLEDAHQRTYLLTKHLDDYNAVVPMLQIVNPPIWELGHVAWFQEFWLQRGGSFNSPSMLPGADRWYDSARVAHDTRWSLDLPHMAATRKYLDTVLEQSLTLLDCGALTDERAYFVLLALFHQDMHNEAFSYTWQTLGMPLPQSGSGPDLTNPGDIEIPASTMMLGAPPGKGFVFDNEKWAHGVSLPAFFIASQVVTNLEFADFVDAGGYSRREYWSMAGWAMRERQALDHPRYWKRNAGTWLVRRFNRWMSIAPKEAVTHVSGHEAEAYCRWAGRRLPKETEWEWVATTRPAQFNYGQVWEWTSSRFLPFAGFSADPYKEYSEPWFAEEHRVLRGGSLVTPRRMMRTTLRNFYKPERADMFCGFRTCAA